MSSKFSVILPAYNAAQTIAATLDKVLAQSFQDFEIIVVNDGSKDDLEAVLKPYFGAHFRYTRQENQGPGAARNTGAALAKGEYLVFLDSDDFVEPGWLEEFHRLSANGAGLMSVACRMPKGIRYPKLLELDGAEYFFSSLAGTFAVKGEVFEKIGGYDAVLRQGENYEMVQRAFLLCVAQALPVLKSDEPLINYNKNMDGGKFLVRAENKAHATIHLLDKYSDSMSPRKRARYFSRAGVNLFRTGKILEARSFFWKAIGAFPLGLNHYLRLAVSFFPPLATQLWRHRSGDSK